MSEQNSHQYWSARHRHIKTSIGQWYPGEDVIVRGRSLLKELIYELSEMQLLVLNITGRVIEKPLADWLEKTRFMTAYPDARIWCNHLASLVGCQGGSPVAGGAISFLAADSKAYGSKVQCNIVQAIQALFSEYQQHKSFDRLIEPFPLRLGSPSIPGFQRPIKVVDERLQPMRSVTKTLGLKGGEYLAFAEEFSAYLEHTFNVGLNAAGYCCSILMDYHFTAEQIYLLSVRIVESGALACYSDYVNEHENGFLPMQCADIHYSGKKIRSISAATSARKKSVV